MNKCHIFTIHRVGQKMFFSFSDDGRIGELPFFCFKMIMLFPCIPVVFREGNRDRVYGPTSFLKQGYRRVPRPHFPFLQRQYCNYYLAMNSDMPRTRFFQSRWNHFGRYSPLYSGTAYEHGPFEIPIRLIG